MFGVDVCAQVWKPSYEPTKRLALLTLQSQEWYTKATFGSYVGQGNCGAWSCPSSSSSAGGTS